MNSIDKPEANKIISYFQSHIKDNYFKRIPLTNQHYQIAKNLLQQYELMLKALDALHLSITMKSNATLVTADKRMAIAAKELFIPIEYFNTNG